MKEIGAALTGMNHVQVHPTGFVMPSDRDAMTKFLAPEALRGVGGVLADLTTGKRFVNELRYAQARPWNQLCLISSKPNGLFPAAS